MHRALQRERQTQIQYALCPGAYSKQEKEEETESIQSLTLHLLELPQQLRSFAREFFSFPRPSRLRCCRVVQGKSRDVACHCISHRRRSGRLPHQRKEEKAQRTTFLLFSLQDLYAARKRERSEQPSFFSSRTKAKGKKKHFLSTLGVDFFL